MRCVDEALPSQQHLYPGQRRLTEREVHRRREVAFLVLAGLFLGTLTLLNILGITRFLDLSFTVPGLGWQVPVPLAVGVLPYPITFLCTDFVSELYGRQRANAVVAVGLLLNLWVVAILWLGSVLPPAVAMDPSTGLPPHGTPGRVFFEVKRLTFGAVTASMIAYLTAQLVDVQLFHLYKRWTRGRMLWLRNNGSTLISQLVDTVAVVLITHYYAHALPLQASEAVGPQLLAFIGAGYAYKLVTAALDTLPFYLGAHWLRRTLRLPPPYPPATPAAA